MRSDWKKIVTENKNRRDALFAPYDPTTGEGSPLKRRKVRYRSRGQLVEYKAPESFCKILLIQNLIRAGSVEKFLEETDAPYTSRKHLVFEQFLLEERFNHDFEFWSVTCVKIQDKVSKQEIPFILNRPQRKTLACYEQQRLQNKPIRAVILKARQWGGSTLTQIYMAWIQTRHKENWHSAVCADDENQSRNIRSMYTRFAKNYPKALATYTLIPYEGSSKNKIIKERGCIIGIGSAQKPDNLRSFDFAMAHLSEVGMWKDTAGRTGKDLATSLRATVPDEPYSLVALESTAKGVGTFFHEEWLAAEKNESNYEPVFVAWWEIERYQRTIEMEGQSGLFHFIKQMNEYDWFLWELGATLEGINWYNYTKEGENYDDWKMNEEFPSTAQEAFISSGHRVFAPLYVQRARANCRKPELIGEVYGDAVKGKEALNNLTFQESNKGNLYVWTLPDEHNNIANRYCTFVDIGGKTDKADWSVIGVLDRYWMMEMGVPECVATWRGHLDQDLVAWKAAQISKFYHNALLAVESNSLRREHAGGDHFLTILDEIVKYYSNLYARTDPEKIKQGRPVKYGFHTGTGEKGKEMIINKLNAAIRDDEYIERDHRVCDEMDYYELKPNGKYGAVDGKHDDLVIMRAGGVWLSNSYMPLPKAKRTEKPKTIKRRRESSF